MWYVASVHPIPKTHCTNSQLIPPLAAHSNSIWVLRCISTLTIQCGFPSISPNTRNIAWKLFLCLCVRFTDQPSETHLTKWNSAALQKRLYYPEHETVECKIRYQKSIWCYLLQLGKNLPIKEGIGIQQSEHHSEQLPQRDFADNAKKFHYLFSTTFKKSKKNHLHFSTFPYKDFQVTSKAASFYYQTIIGQKKNGFLRNHLSSSVKSLTIVGNGTKQMRDLPSQAGKHFNEHDCLWKLCKVTWSSAEWCARTSSWSSSPPVRAHNNGNHLCQFKHKLLTSRCLRFSVNILQLIISYEFP